MKLSKISNRVRWVLALPAMVVAFFCTGIFFGGVLQWNDKLVFVMIALFVFLTGIMVAPLHGKRFITVVASLFIFSCLFPPWRYDHNDPAGYAFLFSQLNRVQIDFGRLFLEWATLAAVTGIVWMVVIKPTRSHDDRANQSSPPTANPKD